MQRGLDGIDARSKLAILAALAFREKITRRISSWKASGAYCRWISRICASIAAIRYTSSARRGKRRGADSRCSRANCAHCRPGPVQGAYNAVWVKGAYGEDTFYYGRGAGALPTGVAVVKQSMRVGASPLDTAIPKRRS